MCVVRASRDMQLLVARVDGRWAASKGIVRSDWEQ